MILSTKDLENGWSPLPSLIMYQTPRYTLSQLPLPEITKLKLEQVRDVITHLRVNEKKNGSLMSMADIEFALNCRIREPVTSYRLVIEIPEHVLSYTSAHIFSV